jgi:hypothetical protein
MTSWRWNVEGRWLCRHCNLPTEWDESFEAAHVVVTVARHPVTRDSAASLAEHYRLYHQEHQGVIDYLTGLG